MAIEIIPKQKIEKKFQISISEIIYYLVVILLITSFLSYFGLDILAKSSQRKLIELKTDISEQETKKVKALEQEVVLKQKKIHVFTGLLDSHKKTSYLFDFLKKNCHEKVVFSRIELDSQAPQTIVSGIASSFRVLGEQIMIFQEQEFIENAELSKASLGKEGGIDFTLKLYLDSQIFQELIISDQ